MLPPNKARRETVRQPGIAVYEKKDILAQATVTSQHIWQNKPPEMKQNVYQAGGCILRATLSITESQGGLVGRQTLEVV